MVSAALVNKSGYDVPEHMFQWGCFINLSFQTLKWNASENIISVFISRREILFMSCIPWSPWIVIPRTARALHAVSLNILYYEGPKSQCKKQCVTVADRLIPIHKAALCLHIRLFFIFLAHHNYCVLVSSLTWVSGWQCSCSWLGWLLLSRFAIVDLHWSLR